MNKELEFWHFIADRLKQNDSVMLLVVAASFGSSPGRRGYKMAVGSDGNLFGSIGGGVMEVRLVEKAKAMLQTHSSVPMLIEQEHHKNSENPSGMICSGRQTVILLKLGQKEMNAVELLVADLQKGSEPWLIISELGFKTVCESEEPQNRPLPYFERIDDIFNYADKLGPKDNLYIIGGGHCSLALSEIMSRLNFKICVIDDRPNLNTLEKNYLAHRITVITDYELVHHQIPDEENTYVVVMTLGYKSDKLVIERLITRNMKYFGVLGSKAKMATLFKELKAEGYGQEKLASIRTPIGIQINSRTPEEIAVSIAAEIISVKNSPSLEQIPQTDV